MKRETLTAAEVETIRRQAKVKPLKRIALEWKVEISHVKFILGRSKK